MHDNEEVKLHCSVCGRAINRKDDQSYDGMCWECWDDRLTEESDTVFDELL